MSFGVPLLLCAGTGLFGLALEGDIDLVAEEVVAAPPEAVFALLDDAEGIARWWGLAMAEAGPAGAPPMTIAAQEGAPSEGVGAKVDFVAGGRTAETWTLLALEPPTRAVYDVDFKIMRVERTLTLTSEAGGTRIRWNETGHIGNPWLRLMSIGGHEEVVANFHEAMQALGRAASQP
ncbi:MAG: SRPBCC family protein [Deltaproteobacteria bacterium]|nr:SRPBCC family protein [Deltaproteobacteria bacterium]